MDVRCDKCATEYEFDSARIGDQGVTVKCTACGYVFRVYSQSEQRPTDSPGDWLVRREDDRLIAFRELTTLQKWIVEGRIDRHDEISKNGETWKQLGNIGELEPFFNVYDRAQALNDLMSTGSVGEHPVTINGSEILTSANPLTSGVTGLIAAMEVDTDADAAQTPRAGEYAFAKGGASPPPNYADPPGFVEPAGLGVGGAVTQPDRERPPEIKAALARIPLKPTGSGQAPTPRNGVPSNGAAEQGAALLSALAHEPSDAAVPRAPSLDLGRSPGFDADLPLRDSLAAEQVVQAYEQGQRRKRTTWLALGAIAAGLLGGGLFALYGTDAPNPVRTFAQNAGLVAAIRDPAIDLRLEQARAAIDLDTQDSLRRADGVLTSALSQWPDDPQLLGERALALTTLSDRLRRMARADEIQLAALTLRRDAHEEAKATYEALSRREKAKAKPPEAPDLGALEGLGPAIVERRTEASRLMKTSFGLAKQANEQDGQSLAAARALADYYRVQRDRNVAPHLERAKALALANGNPDAVTLYIEAAQLAGTVTGATPAALDKASRLLEQALTVRPTLFRARVLLARILVQRGLHDLAEKSIKRVLTASPDHDEALALSARIAAARANGDGTGGAIAALSPGNGAAAAADDAAGAKPAGATDVAAKTPPSTAAPVEPPANTAGAKPESGASANAGVGTGASGDPKTPVNTTGRGRADQAAGRTDDATARAAADTAFKPLPRKPSRADPPPVKPLPRKSAPVADADDPQPKLRGAKAYMAQAKQLRSQGDPWKALHSYERAAESGAGGHAAYAGMGWCYLDLNKPVAAVTQFRRALAANSRSAEAELGWGEALLAQGKQEAARPHLIKVMELSPTGRYARRAKAALDRMGN